MPLDDTVKTEIRATLDKLAANLPGYKKRAAQLQMIADVANTFANARLDPGTPADGQNIGVLEGPTGVGKTLSYLIPAFILAQHLKKHLVVSTATVSLQEQLATKDIPALAKYTGLPIEAVIAKGRGRYVCPARLERAIGEAAQGRLDIPDAAGSGLPPQGNDLAALLHLSKALASGTWNGESDSLKEPLPPGTWEHLTTDSTGCHAHRCSHYRTCPFFSARGRMQDATLIVTNHDLLLSSLSVGDGIILPEISETLLVVDEAHHLPSVTINHFSASQHMGSALGWLDNLQGLVARAVIALGPAGKRFLAITKAADDLVKHLRDLDLALRSNPELARRGVHRYAHGQLDPSMTAFAQAILPASLSLFNKLDGMRAELQATRDSTGNAKLDPLFGEAGNATARARRIADVWELMLEEPEGKAPPIAKWVEAVPTNQKVEFVVCASPVDAAGALANHLWRDACAVILTSATLTALGKFDFFLRKTGLSWFPKTLTRKLPSPFDHENRSELIIPGMRHDPKSPADHTREVSELLPSIIDCGNTGTLVLFASRKQMLEVATAMPQDIQKQLLVQGALPRQDILSLHRKRIETGAFSVIFGLASFGEGLDLPGNLCEHVIIAKLPFAPPDNPIEEATSEWIERRGGNPFMEISVPEASLTLIQQVGRLLRTVEDHGQVTVLDKRLLTKRYGKMMLAALPPMPVRSGLDAEVA